ncbi:branched-chain amino acid ABC transporter permease [Sneathiella chungangensis]|uniref:Branched-chain amino acid ABC transporter permease n=1 Tax=Sneathiella chungangensis TaxID=1418234 RepID=A0A845MGS8_9PROT|nr:branched-chain amino acid ABC transporter permease [Sneathiella chungangensis]MZR23223.1 branched-chain amino acid ABC transporter permease [Sneathiella chungangensis]
MKIHKRKVSAIVYLIVLALFATFAAWAITDNKNLFVTVSMNGLTIAALYFLVAIGFTLIFGLLKNVNLTHGSLYLLGAYLGYTVADLSGSWLVGVAVGTFGVGIVGFLLQVLVFRHMQNQELQQALVTIAISVILADLMLWGWGSDIYQLDPPDWMYGAVAIPVIGKYSIYKLFILGFSISVGLGLWLLLNKTYLGVMIRAGVDDQQMLSAMGVNVHVVFALTFAIGAAIAGLSGVIGGSLMSITPGEDTRYLLASLVVVIVGGMGSIIGTALGAILIGLSEQYGLAYAPTYGVIFTFIIMAAVLIARPQGLLGRE